MSKKFCITAINRLTGMREIISQPCSRDEADAIRARLMSTKSEKRPYTQPQTAEYPQQLNLFTKQLDV